jgi:VacB/RNase II family 3'-5' exoribonuclease
MNNQFDLAARAHQAMADAGFHPDFPAEVLAELKNPPAPSPGNTPKDLRSLLWSSIDNESSRDLDQVEFAERNTDGSYRLLVGIADVDARVPRGSKTDDHAGAETTSVYTGVVTFPMLPPDLSNDLSSLRELQERLALAIELHVLPSGQVADHAVYPASIKNYAKLAYPSVGAWLEGRGPIPPRITAVPVMTEQIQLQREIAEKLHLWRAKEGMLSFSRPEVVAVVDQGQVRDLTISGHNLAEDIIENFMVAANVAMAQFLKERKALCLRRVVKTPRRWERIMTVAAQFGVHLPATPDAPALSQFLAARKQADPEHYPDLSLTIVKLLGPGEYIVEAPGQEHEGHFGLAVPDYTHSTAPNRRYADLVTQRLLKSASAGVGAGSGYPEPQLGAIAAHCTEREDAARKVERLMRKVIAANLLSQRIGEIFDGIVTGAAPKGTYVRIRKFPAEGQVVRGQQGMDVGDRVRVKLTAVDVAKGFIDFERA